MRAALSLVLLLGFYLIALAAAGGVLGASIWVVTQRQSAGAIKILLIGLGVTAAIVIALFKSLRTPRFEPYGLQLTRESAPGLWALTEDTAARVGTRVPDEIWVIPEINAAVVERTKLLGLIGGRRYMMVGLPLLAAFSTDQFRAVIAHELGHYSHAHTKLGALAYRGHIAIGHMLAQFAERTFNPLTWIFRGYAVIYGLAQSAVSRSQEFEADRVAGRIAGRVAMQSALTELVVLDRAWDFYLDAYVAMGMDSGMAPKAIYRGFASLLAARADDLGELREGLPEPKRSLWDSHPPTPVRVAALADAPELGEVTDPRPARELLPDFALVEDRVEAMAFRLGDRTRLDWPEYVEKSYLSGAGDAAEAAFRAAGRAFSADSLDAILAQLEARGAQAQAELDRQNFPESGFHAIVITAAANAKALRVRLSWDGPARLVRPDGEPFPVDAVVEAIRTDPAEARRMMAELGFDPAGATGGGTLAMPSGIGGAVSNVQVNGQPKDVLLTDVGLLFLGCPDGGGGEERLRSLVAHPGGVRALMEWPNASWMPYEDVAGATIDKQAPLKATLRLLSGRQIRLEESWVTRSLAESDRALLELVEGFAQR